MALAPPPARLPVKRRSVAAAVAAVGLLFPLAVAESPAVAAPLPAPSATGTPPTTGQPPVAGRYIVTLREPAAATYTGGVAGKERTAPRAGEGLKADSAPVRAYRDHLRQGQRDAAASVGARVISSYSAALNGFTAELEPEQAERLRTDPTVVSVVKDELRKPLAATTSTDYLGLSGDHGVWAANGGVGKAGQGIVVGVVDTGIAPENPSFAGAPLGTEPGSEPYLDGTTVKYRKADGGTFSGTCTPGVQFTAADCSTKLVSARYFVDNFGAGNTGGTAIGEYLSPRDGEAHGSHTASTAAGANGVEADLGGVALGRISGVSPAAKIAAYKACWSGPDAASPEDDGCATGDLLAAIDAAVADNVDVINYSIGSAGGAQSTDSVVDEAFRNAAASGIFVATAGGNAGPDASTVDNASPWITTAAASTIPTREATAELGDGVNLLGASVSVPAGGRGVSGPLVAASAAGADGAGQPQLCGPQTLDPAKVTGRIVLCERGTVDRLAKSAEVKRAGGTGMILVNPTPDSVDLDAHSVPTLHIDADGYDTLVAYAGTANPTVTLVDGNPHHLASAAAPQIAGFSSRGPLTADGGDLIKPDLAAPGVGILADGANPAGGRPGFTFMSGTSMASPHVAGLAALYLGVHPQATPAEIKSALMTTTSPTVGGDGKPSADVFAQGNGQVDPTRYLNPGLLYLNGPADWARYVAALGGDPSAPAPSDLNLASIGVGSLAGQQTVTRTVTSTAAGTFTADAVRIPGVETKVEPSVLSFTAPGQSKSFRVTFTRTTAPLDEYATGYLTWRNGSQSVRSALAVRPVALVAPAALAAAGSTGRATAALRGGDARDVPVTVTGLARGQRVQGSGTVGSPAQNHIVQIPAGTTHARFDLDAADNTADLDLSVYRLNAYGDKSLFARAATDSADERIDLDDVPAGLYQVEVDFFAGTGPLAFTVTSFALNDKGAEGTFTARPATAHLTIGGSTPVTLAWNGLRSGGVYLGRVGYGDTGRSTYVTVTSDPRTGPPTGTPGARPTVTVTPDYAVPGRPVIVVATGLTPAVDFQIRLKGSGKVLASGRTSDDGGAARSVTLPTGLTAGKQTMEVRYAGRTAADSFTVSPLVLRDLDHVDQQAFDGNPLVALTGGVQGKGKVKVTIRSVWHTYLNRTVPVDSTGWPWLSWKSDLVETRAEKLTATLTVVQADGRAGQSKSVSWTPVASTPSSASLVKDAKAAHAAKLSYTNRTDRTAFPTLRYKLTGGDVVFTTLMIDPGVTFTRSYDTTGVDHLDLVLDGVAVATYRNGQQSGLSGRPAMAEPFYATFHRGTSRRAGDPVSMTLTNRPAAYSAEFILTAGEGTEVYAGTSYFHNEKIPTPRSTQEGAPVSRTLSVPSGRPLWATAGFEVHGPIVSYVADRYLLMTPMTADDLQPVRASHSGTPFVVDVSPRQSPGGTTVSVTAAGLAAHEAWTVRIGGRVAVTGRAGATGFVHAFVRVPAAHGRTTSVRVTGSRSDRFGEAVLETRQ
ncbi:S8 family serine peptidase [Streptomyces sp. NPDC088732]|uniref:S8 family serine peptidase n=1 Tax=Streptomyces sp. NPDC088732 TaxID=3365879 RepID=UPI003827E312